MDETVKVYYSTDPKIKSIFENEDELTLFNNSFDLISIEEIEGSPDAYFIYSSRIKRHSLYHLILIVIHKNFNATLFKDYDLANEVLDRIRTK